MCVAISDFRPNPKRKCMGDEWKVLKPSLCFVF